MANANTADFFGEGVNAGPLASNYVSPDDQPNPNNPGGISNNELARRRAALRSSGVGGGYANPGGSGAITPGGGGSKTLLGDIGRGIKKVATGENVLRGVAAVSTLGGSEIARATGSKPLGLAYNPTGAIGNEKYAQPAAKKAMDLAGIDYSGGGGGGGAGGGGAPGDPTAQVQQGQQDISGQLSPFIDEAGDKGDQALADFYGVEKPENNVAADTQAFVDDNAVDPSLARNAEIDRAFEMSSDLVDRILNAPSQARAIGDQALSQQLALGRSSPGGIGNVQSGVKAAMGAAPRLQAESMQAAANEEQMRNQTAVSAAQIYAGVAQGTADRDVRIAESNQRSAENVLGVLTTQYGMDLNYSTEERAQLGQMARDFYANQAKFVGMDIEAQSRAMDNIVKIYGIKSDFLAGLKKIAAEEGIGEMDAMKLVLGGADAYMKYKTMGAL